MDLVGEVVSKLLVPEEVLSVFSIFYEGSEMNPRERVGLLPLFGKGLGLLRFGNDRFQLDRGHVRTTRGRKAYSLVNTENGPLLVLWQADPPKDEREFQPFFEKIAKVLRAAELLNEAAA